MAAQLRLRRWQAVVLGVLSLALVVAISTALGFAPTGGFDWSVAAVGGTAVGTTLLAIATLALASSTWQDVRASQQIADSTARSLELAQSQRDDQIRPLVIGTVDSITEEGQGDHGHLNVELHNIGFGAAFDLDLTARYDRKTVPVRLAPRRLPAIAAGERLLFAIDYRRVRTVEGELEPMDGELEPSLFELTGSYRDIRFERSETRVFDWQRPQGPLSQYFHSEASQESDK